MPMPLHACRWGAAHVLWQRHDVHTALHELHGQHVLRQVRDCGVGRAAGCELEGAGWSPCRGQRARKLERPLCCPCSAACRLCCATPLPAHCQRNSLGGTRGFVPSGLSAGAATGVSVAALPPAAAAPPPPLGPAATVALPPADPFTAASAAAPTSVAAAAVAAGGAAAAEGGATAGAM